MTTKKIISKRELAIRLTHGEVNVDELSKGLQRTVNLWLSREEVVLENGYLRLVE